MTAIASASSAAKALGIKNLATVTSMTGISPQTLRNWYMNRPNLFRLIVKGCVADTAPQALVVTGTASATTESSQRPDSGDNNPSDDQMADKVAAQQAAAKAALEAKKTS